MSDAPLQIDGRPLTIDDVAAVARHGRPVELAQIAADRMQATRSAVEAATRDGKAHYGINTGFGSLARKRIPAGELQTLQHNLIRSHAAGVGDPLPDEIVRGMMLLLAASLSRGLSGARPELTRKLLACLNAGVTPVVPSIGSVGASGDLAPLAHIGLVLIGEGQAMYRGSVVSGPEAMRTAGVEPIQLEAKEGLALINGTHLMAAEGALLLHDAEILFDAALSACAMSIDACRGTDSYLDPAVHEARRQPGPALVAERLRALLAGSEILPSHKRDDPRVQDPYSLRCAPPVLGAAWDAFSYVKLAVERELGAVTDNPLILPDPDEDGRLRVVSAGNFHGMPLAIPLDTMTAALAHLAGIAERRIYFMLSGSDTESGLHPYLAAQPGLQSGLMIAQYTAAACCNEIAGLATPASVYNVPTSAGVEDYNSFGPRAAAKARRSLDLAVRVVAIELLCAAEALEYQRPLRSGAGVERAHATVRSVVPPLDNDRSPSPDTEAIAWMIRGGAFGIGL